MIFRKVIYLSLFWPLFLFSQEISTTTFIKYFNLNESQTNRGVTVEPITGGFILTGLTSGGDNGGEDVFLMKVSETGKMLWSKTYGGSGNDHGWAVRQTEDEGYVIVGFTDSFGAGALDVYLIKTDAEGNELWSKTFGGSGEEYGWDVRTTSDNGFIIAAQTNSMGNGEIDAWLIKTDSEGNEEWSKTYGGDKVDRIFSVQQANDGGYAAAGITYSYASVSPDDRDGYILKVDASGEEEWYKVIGEDGYDVAHSIAPTSDGGSLVTGYGGSYSVGGGTDVYLIKINKKGKNKWTKALGESVNERGIKGIQTTDNGFVAIGFTDNNWDLLLARTNDEGEEVWTRTFGDEQHVEFGYTVKETRDRGFILIGHRENLATKKSEILLIKTDQEGLTSN